MRYLESKASALGILPVTTQGNHKGLPLQQDSFGEFRKYSYVGTIPCGCPESLQAVLTNYQIWQVGDAISGGASKASILAAQIKSFSDKPPIAWVE